MRTDQKKVVLIGAGLVGMSFAYALLNQNACDQLVLIDLDKNRAEGEAMDLNHGLAFAGSHMKICAGDYPDCADADIVAICAGVAQKPGESRIELLDRNAQVFRSIVGPVVKSGFSGIFLVATNPVDIMTHVTKDLSKFPASRVIGTGTTLDTARLRYLLGEYFRIDPRNIHAYVMGEHGDSEFVPWSQAMVGTKPVEELCREYPDLYDLKRLPEIGEEVRNAAQKIIAAKKSTYYGIGMAMVRIVRAIFGDEHSILTVSAMLEGKYGQQGVYAGVPCTLSREGVERVISLRLLEEEQRKMQHSCDLLRDVYQQLKI